MRSPVGRRLRPLTVLLFAAPFLSPPVAGQDRADVSPVEFWRSVGDPALERLIERALAANNDVRAAQAAVREARATRGEAVLDLLPSVTASAGYSRQRLASAALPGATGRLPDQNVWDAGVHASWEVDVFGRLRHSLEGRNAASASAARDVDDARVLLAADVALAYFALRGAEERLAVARRNAENQRRTLEMTMDRLEAGSGTGLDTERAQAQLSSTLAAVPSLETEVAAARHRIGVLTGVPPGASPVQSPVIDERAPLPLPEIEVQDLESVVRRRPDVRSAERRVDAQEAFVSAARADYLPRLSLEAVAGYTGSELDGLVNSGTARYAVGTVLSWPLFDIGRVKTRVDRAQAAESRAAARYEQTRLLALEEAETALAGYRNARARLGHLEDAAAASERATELARLRFEEGGTDFLEVLDAERRLLEAQDLLAAGRTEATAWLVSTYRALGGEVDGGDS